jgi:hypothetical protein
MRNCVQYEGECLRFANSARLLLIKSKSFRLAEHALRLGEYIGYVAIKATNNETAVKRTRE